MRLWFFHPLILYPGLALISALLIFVSLRPDFAPRAPHPVAGRDVGGVIVLDRDALAAPEGSPANTLYVVRDGLGRPSALRVATKPGQPPLSPVDSGVRLLLNADTTAKIGQGGAIVDVSLRPVPLTVAQGLAVSLQGAGPADWVSQPVSPETQVLRFQLKGAPGGASAIGFYPFSEDQTYNYGVEIVQVRIYAAGAAPAR